MIGWCDRNSWIGFACDWHGNCLFIVTYRHYYRTCHIAMNRLGYKLFMNTGQDCSGVGLDSGKDGCFCGWYEANMASSYGFLESTRRYNKTIFYRMARKSRHCFQNRLGFDRVSCQNRLGDIEHNSFYCL